MAGAAYSDYVTNMASLRCERSTCELPAVAHNHDTLTMVSVLLPAAIVFNAAITWCMHTLLMGKGWRYQVQASQQPIRVVPLTDLIKLQGMPLAPETNWPCTRRPLPSSPSK